MYYRTIWMTNHVIIRAMLLTNLWIQVSLWLLISIAVQLVPVFSLAAWEFLSLGCSGKVIKKKCSRYLILSFVGKQIHNLEWDARCQLFMFKISSILISRSSSIMVLIFFINIQIVYIASLSHSTNSMLHFGYELNKINL